MMKNKIMTSKVIQIRRDLVIGKLWMWGMGMANIEKGSDDIYRKITLTFNTVIIDVTVKWTIHDRWLLKNTPQEYPTQRPS